jgi:hypothetical protein
MTDVNSRVECYGSGFEISMTFIDGEYERVRERERKRAI